MKISCLFNNRKISLVVCIYFFLLSNILFAQNKLPYVNTTYYQGNYDCKTPINEKLKDIVCKNCREIEFSIQKDSIVRNVIDRNCTSWGKHRVVFYPIKSTLLNENTTLHFLKDKDEKLYKAVFKLTEQKLMISGPTLIDMSSYQELSNRLDSLPKSKREAVVFKNEILYNTSYYSKHFFEQCASYPKFTLEIYKEIKKDLSEFLPENLDHSKHTPTDRIRFNNTIEDYFISKKLNPFHGNSYYRTIQNTEKTSKRFRLDKFLAKLNTIFTIIGYLGLFWFLFRIYYYFRAIKSKEKPVNSSQGWMQLGNILGTIALTIGGLVVGFKSSEPIGHALGYTGGSSIMILFVLVISTPVGGGLGLVLGIIITRKTKVKTESFSKRLPSD